jgi:hypothetical protein
MRLSIKYSFFPIAATLPVDKSWFSEVTLKSGDSFELCITMTGHVSKVIIQVCFKSTTRHLLFIVTSQFFDFIQALHIAFSVVQTETNVLIQMLLVLRFVIRLSVTQFLFSTYCVSFTKVFVIGDWRLGYKAANVDMGTNDLGRGLCICEGFHDEVPTRQQQ